MRSLIAHLLSLASPTLRSLCVCSELLPPKWALLVHSNPHTCTWLSHVAPRLFEEACADKRHTWKCWKISHVPVTRCLSTLNLLFGHPQLQTLSWASSRDHRITYQTAARHPLKQPFGSRATPAAYEVMLVICLAAPQAIEHVSVPNVSRPPIEHVNVLGAPIKPHCLNATSLNRAWKQHAKN
jgi:hypothetical protein